MISSIANIAPYDAFIQAMNLMAERLGMTNTRFVNPHGLTADQHKSSCNDLVKLTLAARQLPLFQQVTTTRQHGVQVTGSDGYTRNIKWENTNQLLAIDGYDGVKTGTTDAAGACLVSVGKYKDAAWWSSSWDQPSPQRDTPTPAICLPGRGAS